LQLISHIAARQALPNWLILHSSIPVNGLGGKPAATGGTLIAPPRRTHSYIQGLEKNFEIGAAFDQRLPTAQRVT
jgi:hypothetical protein